jgi:hypothetical protein
VIKHPVAAARYRASIPANAWPWDRSAHSIVLRASGLPDPPVWLYEGPGGHHLLVLSVAGVPTAAVVDVSGWAVPHDPWSVARVLAEGCGLVAWAQTVRAADRAVARAAART